MTPIGASQVLGAEGAMSGAFSALDARRLARLGQGDGVGELPPGLEAGAAKGGQNFGNILGELVQDVAQKGAASGQAVSGLLAGQDIPLHQVMIAMEEASVSFQLMVEVRNKLLESYQELMRMQL